MAVSSWGFIDGVELAQPGLKFWHVLQETYTKSNRFLIVLILMLVKMIKNCIRESELT